jgi:hypothetical protein
MQVTQNGEDVPLRFAFLGGYRRVMACRNSATDEFPALLDKSD